MKQIAFHHHHHRPFGTPQGTQGRRASRGEDAAWVVAATAASRALKHLLAPAPSRTARQRKQVASIPIAPADTAAVRWERQGERAVPWVESLMLVLTIAFFGGGLAAILGGF